MSLLGINVWFMCKHKHCNNVYFKDLIEFVKHKRKDHFIEFQNIKCIVFEEKTEFYPDTAPAVVTPAFTSNSTLETYHHHDEEEAYNNPEIKTKLDPEPVIISSSVSYNIFNPWNRNQSQEIVTHEANIEHFQEIIESADINHQLELDAATYSQSQPLRQPDRSQAFPNPDSDINESVIDHAHIEILPDLPSQHEQSATSPSMTFITNTNNSKTAFSPVSKSARKSKPTSSKIRIKKPTKTKTILKNNQSTQLIPNPYIFVRRLTPLEIQNSSSADAATRHQANLVGEDPLKLKRRRKSRAVHPLNSECPSCHKIIGPNRFSYHLKICGRPKKKRSYLRKVCDECGLQCFDVSSLKIHKLRKHKTEEEKAVIYQYTCPHCPERSFIHQSMLDDHTKVNHGLKANLCHECGMSFLRPYHLARHVLLTHSDESPFKCQEPNCGKAFKIQRYLEVHMASHSQTRPYPCTDPNCKKTFKHPSYVRKHLRQVPHGDASKANVKAKAKESVSTEAEILSNN